MTIKIYRDNDRIILSDESNNILYNYPVGDVWIMEKLNGITILYGQTLPFGNNVYDTVEDNVGGTYTGVNICIYLSEVLYGPVSAEYTNEYEFSLLAGVGGQFVIQPPQTLGQTLQMVAMTYETGTPYDRYGFRKYDILTTPTSVVGFQIETSINNGNVVNITGIFKDAQGRLTINVNGAPWDITFTIKLIVIDSI